MLQLATIYQQVVDQQRDMLANCTNGYSDPCIRATEIIVWRQQRTMVGTQLLQYDMYCVSVCVCEWGGQFSSTGESNLII